MLTRYKQSPGWKKNAIPWLALAGAAVLAIVIVSYFSTSFTAKEQPKPTETVIDFETSAFKSVFTTQFNLIPYVTQKGGSNALVLNGSGLYAFRFPKITDRVFAGRTFGFTLYRQNAGEFAYSIYFGTKILANGLGGLFPEAKGAVVVISRDADTITISHVVAGSVFYSSIFYAVNKTVFHGKEKLVFSFTMLSETSFSAKVNGYDVLRGSTSSYWNTTFSDFEYFATYQYSAGNTPSTTWGYLDDLHVSWV